MLTPIIQIYTSDPSIPGSTAVGYALTEHNRQPMQISYETIENSSRMANGTMRRFVTANKKKIHLSWQTVPTAGGSVFTADSNPGAAFVKSFYEENVYHPVWIKLSYAAEAWRGTGGTTGTVYPANNASFRETVKNTATDNAFGIASVSFSAFSSGSSTATITTTVPHNISSSTTIYVKGINQIFNGTWANIISTGSTTLTFKIGVNNPSATFNINSYVQNGSSAIFSVDSNDFIQTSASLKIANSRNLSGSNIDGNWVVTGKTGTTAFTASWSGVSQTGRGSYGDATILSSSSYSAAAPALSDSLVGTAVTSDILKVFITNFSYTVAHRFALTDYVDMDIEFTEI